MKKEKNSIEQDIKNNPEEEVAEKKEKNENARERSKITKVGAMLKEMRLQKGLKISEVSKYLCIRKHYLEAIEESDYKEIPAFPYGIGFIRSYANFLGLNGENIVDLYKEETNTNDGKNIKMLEPQPEATMPSWQYLLISLVAIVLVYVAWSFLNPKEEIVSNTQINQDVSNVDVGEVIVVEDFNVEQVSEANVTTEVLDSTEADKQITVSEGVYGAEQVENAIKEENGPSAETQVKEIPSTGVFIEVIEDTWIEVKDENKLYLSKVLKAGTSYSVPEGRGMILSVGKHDGVNIYINGVLTKVVRPSKKMNIALDKYLTLAQ